MLTKEYIHHYKKLIIIAYPIVLGQLGHMLTQIADSMMVGQLGANQLAAVSIANSLFFIFFVLAIGFAGGISPLIGKAFGAEDTETAKKVLYNSFLINLIFGILITIVALYFSPAFVWLGQPQEIISMAKSFYAILCFSMLPYMVFLTFKMFAEGLANTFPAMLISLGFNFINIVLNYLLIYGKFGFPEYGMNGAAISTIFARSGMAMAMVIYVLNSPKLRSYVKGSLINLDESKFYKTLLGKLYETIIEKTIKSIDKIIIRELIRLGTPISMQYLMEVGVFAGGTFMVGWFGATYLAAHNISINIAATTFMMAAGISAAATVRVSYFIGRNRFDRMKTSAFASFHLVLAFMGLSAVTMVILRYWLPTLFIDDQQVIEATAQLLLIAVFFQLFDGLQVNALGVLRGMQDVNIPTALNFVNYWLVTFPLCYVLSVVLDLGAFGVWIGYLTGLFLVSVTLYLRFYIIRNSINIKFG